VVARRIRLVDIRNREGHGGHGYQLVEAPRLIPSSALTEQSWKILSESLEDVRTPTVGGVQSAMRESSRRLRPVEHAEERPSIDGVAVVSE